MDSIPIPEPSLSSRAMLCSLSISMWSARKHDPDASEEIAARHGAQSDSGRYHKVLLPKQALAEIQKIVSEARQEHYLLLCLGTTTATVCCQHSLHGPCGKDARAIAQVFSGRR